MSSGLDKKIDAQFILPFLGAAAEVFEVQASTHISAGAIVKVTAEEPLLGDVSGVIGIMSELFPILRMPVLFLLRFFSPMRRTWCL